MQVRLLESEFNELSEIDAGDHTWWVYGRTSDALESLLEIINNRLFEKDQIEIVPEEKYVKCTCTFHKRYDGNKNKDVFDHLTFCKEHEIERPYSTQDHIDNCPECQIELKENAC